MKKIFALALAAIMTAGMTTVAFAYSDVNLVTNDRQDKSQVLIVDSNNDGKFGDDDNAYYLVAGQPVSFGREDGGSKVAIALVDNAGKKITDKDAIKGYKVKATWNVGETEKPEIEYVKMDGTYCYAVTFVLPESDEVKANDLAGEIAVYKNSSDLKDGAVNEQYIKVKVGAEYGYKSDILGYNVATGTGLDFDLDGAEIVEFKEAGNDGKLVKLEGEQTITLGDIFEFDVDVTGQGKLNLKNNQDFNKEFAAMYDYANIDFLTFEMEPSFNKIGTAYIYADEDAFLYEVTADGAKEIKGLAWDEDYEAWTFKTRTLKSYAISDVELTEKTVTEDKDDNTTDGGKENPDTGR